jgi:hypothetical protein
LDRLFARLVDQNIPKVNPVVMKGLACHYMQKADEYVDKVFRSASRSFPPGLEYLGYERCTPREEFIQITRIINNKRMFDLAKSDLYMNKYKFAFNGKPLPDRFIYLPFVGEGGIFNLGGPMYHITPVLSDKVISPGNDSIFVRLLRDKIIFKRCYHSYVVDNVRETTHVIWSQIYRKPKDNSKKVPPTTKANTSIAHYLFAKYGFTKTFEKYCGFVPIVGEEEINTTTYPEDKWVICQSSEIKPKSYIGDFYQATRLRLAIPKDKWNNITKGMVVGFYYVVDHFPSRFQVNSLDNTTLWIILLGHIVFSGHYGENKLYTSIKEHFSSLDDYVDGIIIEKLKESKYYVDNFYDLLAVIIDNFNNLVLHTEGSNLSMYGKSLEVLYYVLYDINSGIFKVNFKLNKLVSKKPLTEKDVNEAFNKNIRQGAVFGLSSGKIISESVSYSGDHLYFKITSKITEQENLPGAARGIAKRSVVGPDKHLDVSMVEAGSVLFLSKSNPTPTTKINPFIHIDLESGTIIPNPKFNAIRQITQNKLKGKI